MQCRCCRCKSSYTVAAKIDSEPESQGLFFDAYNSSGKSSDPAEVYIASLDVRPWTKAAIEKLVTYRDEGLPKAAKLTPVIQEVVDAGGLPSSFILHDEESELLAATALTVKPVGIED